jgi:hypothetical protein
MTVKTRVPATNGKTDVKIHAPAKLDIACGQNKQVGYKGIDIAGDADIIHDLNVTPWPIKTSSVKEAFCSHYVEHIPHHREGWDRDGWWRFFDELYRVMKNEATADFIHPYTMSVRAFWDPTHVRFIHETTWYYLNRGWREANGLDHYPVECNFEVVTIDAIGIADEYMTRNLEQQAYARTHYWNVIPDLRVIIKAHK